MLWHRTTPERLSQEYGTDLQAGLRESEAKLRLAQEGPNELPQAPSVSKIYQFRKNVHTWETHIGKEKSFDR